MQIKHFSFSWDQQDTNGASQVHCATYLNRKDFISIYEIILHMLYVYLEISVLEKDHKIGK
jgi:hypothetical protein